MVVDGSIRPERPRRCARQSGRYGGARWTSSRDRPTQLCRARTRWRSGCSKARAPQQARRTQSPTSWPPVRPAASAGRSLSPMPTGGAGSLVGLGARAELTPEHARVAAAAALRRANDLAARTLCWLAPADADDATVAAIVEGTVLADYRFEHFKSAPPSEEQPRLERLVVAGPDTLEGAVGDAAVIAARVNRARDLQNRPANDLTPTALGEYARADRRGDPRPVRRGRRPRRAWRHAGWAPSPPSPRARPRSRR